MKEKKVLVSARLIPRNARLLIDTAYARDVSVSSLVNEIIGGWIEKNAETRNEETIESQEMEV